MATTTTKSPTPAGLSKRSSTLYRSVVGEYDLADAEVELLTEACRALDRVDEARVVVAAVGLTTVDRYGGIRLNPAVAVEQRAREQFARLIKQLGVRLDDDEPADKFGRRTPGPKITMARPR